MFEALELVGGSNAIPRDISLEFECSFVDRAGVVEWTN